MLHLIQWNASRSCYQLIGHYFTKQEALASKARVRGHFNFTGTASDLEIISDYQLGYLEGCA